MVDMTTDNNGTAQGNDVLPFSVEVADGDNRTRILARAASASLAQAIFSAAHTEYPGRRILLKRSGETIADSARSSTSA
jgi:hypothetical protein